MWYESVWLILVLIICVVVLITMALDLLLDNKHERDKSIMRLQHKQNIEMEEIRKGNINKKEELVKSLVLQRKHEDKQPKIWAPIKKELVDYLIEKKKVYDNEENEADRYNAGLCYKHDTALQIILDLPTEG